MAEEKSGALEGGTARSGARAFRKAGARCELSMPSQRSPETRRFGEPVVKRTIADNRGFLPIGAEMGAFLVPMPQSVAGMPITAAFSCNPCVKSGTLCSAPRIAAAMP